jgi:hypothetical protein
LPSIYDDSYARVRRSLAATTTSNTALSPPPPPTPALIPKSNSSNDQTNTVAEKLSLTDVILQGPSLQDTCVSDSTLCQLQHVSHEQKKMTNKHRSRRNNIRRAQSDLSTLLMHEEVNENSISMRANVVESPSITTEMNKKSKSMVDNLDKIRLLDNPENETILESNNATNVPPV